MFGELWTTVVKMRTADAVTVQALREALDDEYHARATYRAVIAALGPIQPFVRIVEAEGRHVRALERQFARLGLTSPGDLWPGRVAPPLTLTAACERAVQAEIANAALDDRLIAQDTDAQVRRVLARLREASQERHLPAFRRCSALASRPDSRLGIS